MIMNVAVLFWTMAYCSATSLVGAQYTNVALSLFDSGARVTAQTAWANSVTICTNAYSASVMGPCVSVIPYLHDPTNNIDLNTLSTLAVYNQSLGVDVPLSTTFGNVLPANIDSYWVDVRGCTNSTQTLNGCSQSAVFRMRDVAVSSANILFGTCSFPSLVALVCACVRSATFAPSRSPTHFLTSKPSGIPTRTPSQTPSIHPTSQPTLLPTTIAPSPLPTTMSPTAVPAMVGVPRYYSTHVLQVGPMDIGYRCTSSLGFTFCSFPSNILSTRTRKQLCARQETILGPSKASCMALMSDSSKPFSQVMRENGLYDVVPGPNYGNLPWYNSFGAWIANNYLNFIQTSRNLDASSTYSGFACGFSPKSDTGSKNCNGYTSNSSSLSVNMCDWIAAPWNNAATTESCQYDLSQIVCICLRYCLANATLPC